MGHKSTFVMIGVLTAVAALAEVAPGANYEPPRTSREIALTFDDLPYAADDSGPGDLTAAQTATRRLLRTLRQHHAPAIGFVIEAQLQVTGQRDARIALLQEWADSGMELGNHTYAHTDYDTASVQQYEDDIIRGEVVTRSIMWGQHQLYFRSPRTHTGDTPEKKRALLNFLTARGYKLTPHTVENSDFLFDHAYRLAQGRNDEAQVARIRHAYLDFTLAALAFAERASGEIFGREIPQTMLLHANDINADCLNDLMLLLEARGYRAVSLGAVMSDAAYMSKDTLVTKFGPTWLWRWMKTKGMKVSFSADPEPPDWIKVAAQGADRTREPK